jgi:hypothetical protein
LYDGFLQFMTITWAVFMRSNGSQGKAIRDNFQNKIYPEVGLYLFGLSVIMTVLYYYYLNWRFGRYYSVKSWAGTLLGGSLLLAVISYIKAKDMLDNPAIDMSKHLQWFAAINGIYSGTLFLLFSMLIKWWSPMGRRTPF